MERLLALQSQLGTDPKRMQEGKDPPSSVSQMERNMSDVDGFGTPYEATGSSDSSSRLRRSFHALKSRKHAILASLIHVPSMAISLGVLSLTFRNVFWEAPGPQTNGTSLKAPPSSCWPGRLSRLTPLSIF